MKDFVPKFNSDGIITNNPLAKKIETGIIENELQKAVNRYADSQYHTNAGKWLRFIARIIPVTFIVRLAQAKLGGKK